MSKFNLSDYIKDVSNLDTVSESDTGVRMIPISELHPNGMNFYGYRGEGELADSIKLSGLMHPLTVIRRGNGYTVISGHRRLRALRMLYEQSGFKDWAEVPCTVLPDPEDPVKEKLMLIQANSTGRELNGMEIARQARELTECLVKLKERGVELPGKMRDIVAEQMQISASKLARAQATEKNLKVPGLVEAWKDNKLNESVAYELSQIPERDQYKALDLIIDSGKDYKELTAADVKKLRGQIDRRESTKQDLLAAAQFRGIQINDEDFTPLWCWLLAKTGIPESISGLGLKSRKEAEKYLYDHHGFSHHGASYAAVSFECMPNGIHFSQPVNHRLGWGEIFDCCALLALNGLPAETDDDDEDELPAPGAGWHQCLREDPAEGQLVAVIFPAGYRDGMFEQSIMRYKNERYYDDFWEDDPEDDMPVTSLDWWTALPELPEVD